MQFSRMNTKYKNTKTSDRLYSIFVYESIENLIYLLCFIFFHTFYVYDYIFLCFGENKKLLVNDLLGKNV
jgi:hypothetical protein